MAIIEVKHLSKKYKQLIAVDNISFQVKEGETFGILGPNGAGKTTALEMIEGLRKATSGTIKVDGKDIGKETRAVKSVIGVQLQASSFFDYLNLRELIDTFAALYNRKVDATALLKEVQLEEKSKNQVKELSGGQKQRLSIAVGLVNDPKIFFLDEPTTGLDPQARRNLWDLITQIKSKGKTIVLTTHYLDEAEVLCDRIAIMDHAKIIALDTVHNLITKTGTHPTIEFRSSSRIERKLLSDLPGVEKIFHKDHTYSLRTSEPQVTLDALFSMLRKNKTPIEELTLKRATLEDVFLKLTGHGLRE